MPKNLRRLGLGTLVLALSVVTAVPGSAAPTTSGQRVEVVARSLDNPRGVTVTPGGVVMVAESGRGPARPGEGPCAPGPEGQEVCFGRTGAVTAVWGGYQRRIVKGLPSLAGPGGAQATGPSDVSVHGARVLVTIGLGGNPATRAQFGPAARRLGTLVRLKGLGVKELADLAQFEQDVNPDGVQPPDSNPNGVLALRYGRAYAVDAGGNSLVHVARDGRVRAVATFPSRQVRNPGIPDLPPVLTMQAVPTSVVKGPDGALYVGELTGFPFEPGAARVWRIVPGQAPTVYATGFTNIIDVDFDARGRLHVLEIFKNGILSNDPEGALIRVNRDGSRVELAAGRLVTPGGMAFARDGSIYVSNRSIEAGTGELLRVR